MGITEKIVQKRISFINTYITKIKSFAAYYTIVVRLWLANNKENHFSEG